MRRDSRHLRGARRTGLAAPRGSWAWLRACAPCAALVAACAAPGPPAAPTPQRPTFSSDASTTAEGTLELEAGADVDPGDAFSDPLAVKLGVGPRSEAYVAFTPLVVIERSGPDEQGFGDVSLGLRHRFWENAAADTAAALQVATKLPTAKDGLGSGEIDFLTAAALTHTADWATLNLYYELALLGDPDGRGVDDRHGLALAGSRTLFESLGGFAELAGFTGQGDPVFLTAGLTLGALAGTIVDLGLRTGLNDDAEGTALLLGFTTNVGRLSWAH